MNSNNRLGYPIAIVVLAMCCLFFIGHHLVDARKTHERNRACEEITTTLANAQAVLVEIAKVVERTKNGEAVALNFGNAPIVIAPYTPSLPKAEDK